MRSGPQKTVSCSIARNAVEQGNFGAGPVNDDKIVIARYAVKTIAKVLDESETDTPTPAHFAADRLGAAGPRRPHAAGILMVLYGAKPPRESFAADSLQEQQTSFDNSTSGIAP
jgi:hypothetical protein